jgi:hypothetical protein
MMLGITSDITLKKSYLTWGMLSSCKQWSSAKSLKIEFYLKLKAIFDLHHF